ncbi:FUSC family protein [Antrihabitans sp. NCIMB 15449]|uniref:FUSC family protein n=1 Tax=Antrihabitans spumae TaxID=3373370 RepID=A0ABW7JH64_9NOCA
MNRIAGSIIGAVIAAAILLTGPDDWVLALCAAISMGLSALAAPKIYGLFVIGITSSTLLSASIGEVNRLAPELRLLDTLLGCTVAVVIGYVLWPGKLFATHTPLENAKRSTVTYLRAAADPKPNRLHSAHYGVGPTTTVMGYAGTSNRRCWNPIDSARRSVPNFRSHSRSRTSPTISPTWHSLLRKQVSLPLPRRSTKSRARSWHSGRTAPHIQEVPCYTLGTQMDRSSECGPPSSVCQVWSAPLDSRSSIRLLRPKERSTGSAREPYKVPAPLDR